MFYKDKLNICVGFCMIGICSKERKYLKNIYTYLHTNSRIKCTCIKATNMRTSLYTYTIFLTRSSIIISYLNKFKLILIIINVLEEIATDSEGLTCRKNRRRALVAF